MVALQVGPAPHAAVNDMRQSLPVGNLQPAIQRAGNGNTVTGLPRAAQGFLQFLHGPFLFLQFFHQSINSFLCPFFFFIALFPPKKSLHRWTCEGKQTGHIHSDGTRYTLLVCGETKESPNCETPTEDSSLYLCRILLSCLVLRSWKVETTIPSVAKRNPKSAPRKDKRKKNV